MFYAEKAILMVLFFNTFLWGSDEYSPEKKSFYYETVLVDDIAGHEVKRRESVDFLAEEAAIYSLKLHEVFPHTPPSENIDESELGGDLY